VDFGWIRRNQTFAHNVFTFSGFPAGFRVSQQGFPIALPSDSGQYIAATKTIRVMKPG
jgi:hypothetical protein